MTNNDVILTTNARNILKVVQQEPYLYTARCSFGDFQEKKRIELEGVFIVKNKSSGVGGLAFIIQVQVSSTVPTPHNTFLTELQYFTNITNNFQ